MRRSRDDAVGGILHAGWQREVERAADGAADRLKIQQQARGGITIEHHGAIAGADRGGSHCLAVDRAGLAGESQSAAGEREGGRRADDIRRRRSRSREVEVYRALVDRGRAGVGVGAGERERASAGLVQGQRGRPAIADRAADGCIARAAEVERLGPGRAAGAARHVARQSQRGCRAAIVDTEAVGRCGAKEDIGIEELVVGDGALDHDA